MSDSRHNAVPASDSEHLLQMLVAPWITRCIYAAAQLGIADLLASGPRSPDDIAREISAHGPSVYRMLRALASQGLFMELDDGRFDLTPLAELLRSDHPGSMRAFAVTVGVPGSHQAWGEVVPSIRTGISGFLHAHETTLFDY